MAVMGFSSLVQALVGSAVLYLLYCIYWELTVGASRRSLIKQHGCKPLRSYNELNSFPQDYIGLKAIQDNMKAFKKHKILELWRGQYLRNGNTISQKQLFTPMISTIEPENVKTIMALKFKDWGLPARRQQTFLPLLGSGIFTTNGAAWQHSRDLLRPNFVRSQVGDLETFEIHIDQLLKALPHDGSTVNLQDFFFDLTMDSATEFLFGESTDCLKQGPKDAGNREFAVAFNRSQEQVALAFNTGRTHPLFRSKQFWKDKAFLDAFVDKFVHRALEYTKRRDTEEKDPRDGERYVFLYELAKATSDPIQIRSELIHILLAGRDTTASLLSDVFFVLARRPDIWTKLRAEVDALEGKKPTFQQLKDMKYLRQILNESLRLYPVVPQNAREAQVDTVLPLGGGQDGKSPLFIPKGQNVQWTAFAMHRRKDWFGEDAEEFKPERWDTLRPGWEYLPFNGGPRICLGQQFALTEASYTTCRLLQEFRDIENRDQEPSWQECITLTCAIKQGTKVALTPF